MTSSSSLKTVVTETGQKQPAPSGANCKRGQYWFARNTGSPFPWTRSDVHRVIFRCAIMGVAACIPFSPGGCRICLTLLVINWLAEGRWTAKIRLAFRNPVMICCALCYLWEIAGVIHTHHFQSDLHHAETEASFLVIPLLFFSNLELPRHFVRRTMCLFCVSVALTALYCLVANTIGYLKAGNPSRFFYHALVAPVHQHAVYFSIYVFICIAWLLHDLGHRLPRRKLSLQLILLACFCGWLFLLRSKMVVGIMLVYACLLAIRSLIAPRRKTSMLLAALAILLGTLIAFNTPNPLSRQMRGVDASDLRIWQVSHFSPDDYFNEVQLRVTLWKFSLEILAETHSWLTGVSAGDAHFQINRQITSHGMYTGVPGTSDTGYLNYNLHNQFLETLLRSGAIGLMLLLAFLYAVFRRAVAAKDGMLLATLGVFCCVFLTESVLERQIGIVPFFFFLCLLLAGRHPATRAPLQETHS